MAKLNENTEVAMPIRNMVSIIVVVAVSTWAYFGIIERLNNVETEQTLMSADLEKNTEFRIKWPRGELGQSQSDLEQYMMIEELYKNIDKMQQHLDSMADNKINIEFLQEQMEKAQQNIDKLKDADREIVYKNGNGN